MRNGVDREAGRTPDRKADPWQIGRERLAAMEDRRVPESGPPRPYGVARELRGLKTLRELLGLE
jgi:hypothetical protein